MERREIRRGFQTGALTPATRLYELRHIGPYLYRRLVRAFARAGAGQLTIRGFFHGIRRLDSDALKSRLQRALQNERNNRCVPSRRSPNGKHRVADYNRLAYKTMLSLARAGAAGDDGHGLCAGARYDARALRLPAYREEITKHVSCSGRRGCRGVYADGLCQPARRARGFDGVSPFAGQASGRGGQRRRCAYAAERGGTRWRRPGRCSKAPIR